MKRIVRVLLRWAILVAIVSRGASGLNLAPFFTADMNQHTIPENSEVGSFVYQLEGEDPEGSKVFFGIEGTDKFEVDRETGVVTIKNPIDRESLGEGGFGSENEIRLTVTIEDEVMPSSSSVPNVVRVPVSVIILDVNDNEPVFRGTPYEANVNEDTPVGTTIFRAIEATDRDLVGEVLDVRCVSDNKVCEFFEIVPRREETDHDMYRGSVVLKRPLDYRERQVFRFQLEVFDGLHRVSTDMIFTVNDVQNTPPVFMGSMTGIVNEDDPVGTSVMKVRARDGDTGNQRRIIYDLIENPNSYFAIDINTGEIRVDKSLDREALGPSGGVLNLKVKAMELVEGVPGNDPVTSSIADVTITIRDVNDEPPTFNQQEYEVFIPENVPYGTPLANLNMEIKDTDTGPYSNFNVNLIDETNKFAIEPRKAAGHTAVSIKVNSQNLDYENPNERKFLLLVVATESNKDGKKELSSTATVTVQVQDLNDNSPVFDKDSFTTIVSEQATAGTEVITITARDRDSNDYGTKGIRYELSGAGAELFNVDPITGKITVAPCSSDCLDYEKTKAYFLSFSATDNNGEGKRTVANLRITVEDANDNSPMFLKKVASASINEGQTEFQPRLFMKAEDIDASSILKYEIVDGNVNNLFAIDSTTGEISVRSRAGLRLDNIPTNVISLTVTVTDGLAQDTASVDISVKDVNDRKPEFEKQVYLSSVPENAPIGSPVENVLATDADYGENAELTYRIQKGAFNDFDIDPVSGLVSTIGKLDYDRRDSYTIEVVAVDGGLPSLTGTTTLTVSIMNKNVKLPFFSPATQRIQVTEDTEIGSVILRLNASDPDIGDDSTLLFSLREDKPVTAVDKDGKPVSNPEIFSFFSISDTTGEVSVTNDLDRNIAAVVTLPVQASDFSASPPQHGYGTVVITLVDINDYPPEFQGSWTPESPYMTIHVAEELENGTFVHKFVATDSDSNIDYFSIEPENEFFGIERGTGRLFVKSRIDYETMGDDKAISFALHVFDTGIPQKNATAFIRVQIDNVNDNDPIFEKMAYEATVKENSDVGTEIFKVSAHDMDKGEFGLVQYALAGNHFNVFGIDPQDGIVRVRDPESLDREIMEHFVFQVVAFDLAEEAGGTVRSTSVQANVTIGDVNDNPPFFLQKEYAATVVDNIPYFPDPSPIVQLMAADADAGINAKLYFSFVEGNEDNLFVLDSDTGIIYPNASLRGQSGRQFLFLVKVSDEGTEESIWAQPDMAHVSITIENVNTHKPEWFPEPPLDETIEIPEETDHDNVVILKVNARDKDIGENQRISYFLKVQNENVYETENFSIDEVTGELRAKGRFDRETMDEFELVLVARDHGTPVAFETLRLITVMITDVNDNAPEFPIGVSLDRSVRFTLPEEEEPGYFVGRVEAKDPDIGNNGKVYYYIVSGNDGGWFSIDKSYGNIYTKKKIDREDISEFTLIVRATNEANSVCSEATCDEDMKINEEDLSKDDPSVLTVQIFVQDINDNLPQFDKREFFVGIPYDAKVNDLIIHAEAQDPDLEDTGELSYAIKSSNLYKSGNTKSSGSLVPSPFKMKEGGRMHLSSLMAEFNQDLFITDVEAKDSRSGHRAKTRIHISVYDPEQLIMLTVAKPPELVNSRREKIVSELRNVTRNTIFIDDIRFHIDPETGQQRRDMTDMFIHAIDHTQNMILSPDEVLKSIDVNADFLKEHYEEMGIKHIVSVATQKDKQHQSYIDEDLLALILILILIFFGVITFSILCCCMKSWVAKASSKAPSTVAMKSSKKMTDAEMPIYNAAVDDGPASLTPAGGTDNPLWIDQKYKAYEEQELTMTVFSDQDNSVISGAQDNSSGHQSQEVHMMDTHSNAYATINKLPMASGNRSIYQAPDYATLEKPLRSPPGPIVPGVHSTPIHQEDSFSRRMSRDQLGNDFVINRNGEPELLADLI